MEEHKKETNHDEEDLGNYITQVVTDIGKPINKKLLMDKIAQQVPKVLPDGSEKKMRCKMASATNAWGITADEYSKYALHVYQYLSYTKTTEVPDDEELKEVDKMVDIEGADTSSKSISMFSHYIPPVHSILLSGFMGYHLVTSSYFGLFCHILK